MTDCDFEKVARDAYAKLDGVGQVRIYRPCAGVARAVRYDIDMSMTTAFNDFEFEYCRLGARHVIEVAVERTRDAFIHALQQRIDMLEASRPAKVKND